MYINGAGYLVRTAYRTVKEGNSPFYQDNL